MFFGGVSIGGSGQIQPTRLIAPRPPPPPHVFGPFQLLVPPGLQPGSPIGDTWGAIQVPAQPTPQIPSFPGPTYQGDPALLLTLGFLYDFLVTDGNASTVWTGQTGYPLIKSPLSLFAHNPNDVVFNNSYLPALYLFRDDAQGSKYEREADDWEVETSIWTMLWATPLGGQDVQLSYRLYMNQFVKALVMGLERGQTPSWIQPGDTDPSSQYRGSYLPFFTNVMRQRVTSAKRAKIKAKPSNGGPTIEYPAVEIKWEVREKTQADLRRFAPNSMLEFRLVDPFGRTIQSTTFQ